MLASACSVDVGKGFNRTNAINPRMNNNDQHGLAAACKLWSINAAPAPVTKYKPLG